MVHEFGICSKISVNWGIGSVAEWSKALDLGSSLSGGVGSNPTAIIPFILKSDSRIFEWFPDSLLATTIVCHMTGTWWERVGFKIIETTENTLNTPLITFLILETKSPNNFLLKNFHSLIWHTYILLKKWNTETKTTKLRYLRLKWVITRVEYISRGSFLSEMKSGRVPAGDTLIYG